MNRDLRMRRTRIDCGLAALLSVVLCCSLGFAADAPVAAEAISQEDRDFFETSLRPVLINRCQDCHSSDNRESQFSVEHLAEMLPGGSRGRAIVPAARRISTSEPPGS